MSAAVAFQEFISESHSQRQKNFAGVWYGVRDMDRGLTEKPCF